MPANKESKHAKFLRLMQRRLERAKEEMRLISQLSTRSYEHTPEEAEEVVRILDEDIRHVAQVFRVEYATRIGKAVTQRTNGAAPIGPSLKKQTLLDEIEIVKILDDLRAGNIEDAMSALRSACAGTGKRAA